MCNIDSRSSSAVTSDSGISNNPSRDYTHSNDRDMTSCDMTPGFKPVKINWEGHEGGFVRKMGQELCTQPKDGNCSYRKGLRAMSTENDSLTFPASSPTNIDAVPLES